MMFSEHNPLLTMDYLITEEEGQKLERKEGKIKPEDLAKAILAMANTEGGTIVLGQRNDKIFAGLNEYDPNKIAVLLDVANTCIPLIPVIVEEKQIVNNKGEQDKFYLIHVEPSQALHRRSDGKVFRRVGDSSIEAKGEVLRHLEYEKGVLNYEEEYVPYAELEHLSEEMFEVFKNEQRRIGNEYNKTFKEFLVKQHLIVEKNGETKIKRVAALTFSPDGESVGDMAQIRIIKVNGTEKKSVNTSHLNEIDTIDGSLYYQVNQAMDTLMKVMDSRNIIGPDGNFQVVYQYPLEALREALINAVIHRSYSLQGIEIMIWVYTDRIEIQSPGGLPGTVTLDNITKERFSRNKKVAQIMSYLGMVRKIGEGMDRIFEEMKAAGLPKPQLRVENQVFTVTLRNDEASKKALAFLDTYGEEYKKAKKAERKELLRNVEETARNYYGMKPHVWETLSPDEQMVLVYAVNGKKIYRRDVELVLGKSKPIAIKVLDSLIRNEFLFKVSERENDKEGHYVKA